MSCSRRIRVLSEGTILLGELAKGCELCLKGAKMVLFITGLCNHHCWYCPISTERKGHDVIYANERRIGDLREIVREAELMDAEGTGITGGEPLLVFERLVNTILLLKRELGKDHHVHLYTNGLRLSQGLIRRLSNVGLDELRIHPVRMNSIQYVVVAKKYGIDVGIEMPVIPGMIEYYKNILTLSDKLNVDFVNLNELEFSEGNFISLKLKGLRLKPNSQVAVDGSETLALELMRWASENTGLNLHYCPANVKDRVQLKRRLIRTSMKVRKPHEEVDEEGLLIKGVIYCPSKNLLFLFKKLCNHFPLGLIYYNVEDKRIEFHISLIDEIPDLINKWKIKNVKIGVIKEYPWGRLKAEFYPISET